MAGQGTVGLEILEDVPQVTDVVISVAAADSWEDRDGGQVVEPAVRIWGVETEGADCMSNRCRQPDCDATRSRRWRERWARRRRVSGLWDRRKICWKALQWCPDREALSVMRLILERLKVLTEPAASCTLAAADRCGITSLRSGMWCCMCGGNMSIDDLARC